MIEADALSRGATTSNQLKKKIPIEEILKIHKQFNHRKNIQKELNQENIFVTNYT